MRSSNEGPLTALQRVMRNNSSLACSKKVGSVGDSDKIHSLNFGAHHENKKVRSVNSQNENEVGACSGALPQQFCGCRCVMKLALWSGRDFINTKKNAKDTTCLLFMFVDMYMNKFLENPGQSLLSQTRTRALLWEYEDEKENYGIQTILICGRCLGK